MNQAPSLSSADSASASPPQLSDRPNVLASIPFVAMHLLIGLTYFTGISWELVLLAIGSYYLRMFGVTAGYHRYFAHRAFKTNRVFQFFLAFLAETSAQKGVLWWASHHRHHHRYSDQAEDVHSPGLRGFWYSHVGWILADRYVDTNYSGIKDFARFPELRFLNNFYLLPPALYFLGLYAWGGFNYVVWGGVVSTVLLWHGTFCINSLCHIIGRRRYKTTDLSRNSFALALITTGEGWHNNHHYHQNTANQGWFWWEIDLTYYVLVVLSWVGLVSDLRKPSTQTKFAFKPTRTPTERAQAREPLRNDGAGDCGNSSRGIGYSPSARRCRGTIDDRLSRLADISEASSSATKRCFAGRQLRGRLPQGRGGGSEGVSDLLLPETFGAGRLVSDILIVASTRTPLAMVSAGVSMEPFTRAGA